jgi:hypothetical protein
MDLEHIQIFVNVAFALVGGLCSWVLKFLYDRMKDLQVDLRALADQLQGVEVLVAGQYVKRVELDRIYDALIRIENKLDGKADK